MSSNPFLSSTHGHPNFNPVKTGKNSHVDVAKNSKQPKPPEKPLMPYMRYSKKVWDEVRVQYPDLKIWEISKIVGQMWRDLPDEEKQEYIDAFESEKAEYNESLKVYHNSSAYQSWISSLKTKVNKEHEERDTQHKRKEKKSIHSLNSPQKSDGRVSLQTMDSEMDDEDEYFSMKHLSAARFYRNHRLVAEIFSDTVLPDVRTVVSEARLQVLRSQVESLKKHQKKLDEEIEQIELNFQEKKRALLESSERFNAELNKRLATTAVDDATYQKMVEKALEQLRQDHASALQAQASVPQASTTSPTNSTSIESDNSLVSPVQAQIASTTPIVSGQIDMPPSQTPVQEQQQQVITTPVQTPILNAEQQSSSDNATAAPDAEVAKD